jgi:DNA repair exonuclease SbcCD ATPase subunit
MSKQRLNGQDLESELAELKKRKALLEMHLKENNVALTAAKDARRHALLDASTDDVEVYVHRDRTVVEAEDRVAGIEDALEMLTEKISEVEAKIVQERSERDKAAADLNARADTLTAAVEKYRDAGLNMLDAMKPLAGLPTISPDFFPRMQVLIPEMVIAALQLSKDGRSYAERIQQDTAPIPGKPAKAAPSAPKPKLDMGLYHNLAGHEYPPQDATPHEAPFKVLQRSPASSMASSVY